MKNLKKFAAVLSAAAVMTMSVSAFADTTASYDSDNVLVKLSDTDILTSDTEQYTVVVIPQTADTETASLTEDDILYINQGTNGETYWTDGMGVKQELTAGNYLVRIGGTALTEVIEIPLTVGADATYTLGDINMDTAINMADAAAILNHFMGDSLITDENAKLAADVNIDTAINMADAAAILNHFMGDALIVQPQ